MKYNIHVTQAAERDMANAYDYIDLVLKNPTAADKLLDVADEKIGALAEFPHKFEVVSDKLLCIHNSAACAVLHLLADVCDVLAHFGNVAYYLVEFCLSACKELSLKIGLAVKVILDLLLASRQNYQYLGYA